MRRFTWLLLLLTFQTKAEVTVEPITAIPPIIQNFQVGPGRYQVIPLPSANINDQYRIGIKINNAVYKDLTAFILDNQNLGFALNGQAFRGKGYQRVVAPFQITGSTGTPGPHYLLLDNRYAGVITKQVQVSIEARVTMAPDQQRKIKETFEKLYANLKQDIVFPDFNINVEACDMVNAYSSSDTGNITYCSEMISELARTNNIGAFTGIFLHEVGHTLLALWGIPGENNEDIADEFATYTLMAAGPNGYALLNGFLDYWQTQDSMGEAQHILQHGDRHSLSIQRVRNIRENMNSGEAFIEKWNHLMYQHYTRQALQRVITKPRFGDDVELARITLERQLANAETP